MEHSKHILLIISIYSLILSISAKTTSPSPAPILVSDISSSPDASLAPVPISHSSSSPAPTLISHISSSPNTLPNLTSPDASPSPSPSPNISSSPDASLAPAPISHSSSSPAPTPISHISSSPNTSPNLTSPDASPSPSHGLLAKFISSISSSPGISPSQFEQGSNQRESDKFDDVITNVLEARIKQGASDSELAIEEAKKLLNDPTIAASETGECLRQCVDKYGASLDDLNRAMEDLGVRDASLLVEDFSSVEAELAACQKCFSDNLGEDSPLKDLEEAATKAARDCLTVLDYSR